MPPWLTHTKWSKSFADNEFNCCRIRQKYHLCLVFGRGDRRAEEVKVLMPVDTQSSLPTTMYLPAIKKVFFLRSVCVLYAFSRKNRCPGWIFWRTKMGSLRRNPNAKPLIGRRTIRTQASASTSVNYISFHVGKEKKYYEIPCQSRELFIFFH